MAEPTFTGSTNNRYIDAAIYWQVNSQDVTANTSVIYVELWYRRNNSGYTTSGTWSGGITCDGQTQTGSKHLDIGTSWVCALAASFTVPHNSDGSKTITISATGGISGTSFTSTSISGNGTLPQIPRASSASFPGAITLGETFDVTVNAASANFTHNVYLAVGDSGWISVATIGNGVSTMTASVDIASYITNSPNAGGTFALQTMSGATQIGWAEYSVMVYVPASLVPSASWASLTINKGAAPSEGVLVKGYGSIDWSVAFAGSYGSTLKSCTIYYGNVLMQGQSGNSGILQQVGSYNLYAVITDSRDRSITLPYGVVTVLDYNPPTMSPATGAYRSDASGNASPSGTYLKVTVGADYSTVNGHNALHTYYRTKLKDSDWGGYTEINNGATVLLSGYVISNSYDVELLAVDTFGNSRVIVVAIPTGEMTFQLRRGGKGAAFGKYAEHDNLLDVAWDMNVEGNLTLGSDTDWIQQTLGTNYTLSYRRKAGWVCVMAECAGVLTLHGSYETIFTLPEGFRPGVRIPFVWSNMGGTQQTLESQSNYVNPDGTIQLFASREIAYWSFSVAYPV